VNPLPPPLGSGALVLWRLDQARYADGWNSGEGAYLAGGRWNSGGTRVVYASLDPATAILEVAAHTTFRALDTVPHILTRARIADAACVHVLPEKDVPQPDWLVPGIDNPARQKFGDALVRKHAVVLLPSAVSRHSWNAIFDPAAAAGLYDDVAQEPFVFDPRLHGVTQ
jgi:RES domain-containing protein